MVTCGVTVLHAHAVKSARNMTGKGVPSRFNEVFDAQNLCVSIKTCCCYEAESNKYKSQLQKTQQANI